MSQAPPIRFAGSWLLGQLNLIGEVFLGVFMTEKLGESLLKQTWGRLTLSKLSGGTLDLKKLGPLPDLVAPLHVVMILKLRAQIVRPPV